MTVDNGRARLPLATCGLADISADLVMNSLPGAVDPPTPEVVVDGLPARHVVWQQPPSTSGADQVQDRVQDCQAIMFRGAPSKFGRRQQPLDSFAFFLAQVAGIAGSLHTSAIAWPRQTSTFQTRSQTIYAVSDALLGPYTDKGYAFDNGPDSGDRHMMASTTGRTKGSDTIRGWPNSSSAPRTGRSTTGTRWSGRA